MTTAGVAIGLFIAIVLIINRIEPVYGMIIGALIGGLVGGHDLVYTIAIMIDGIKDMIPAIIRIITAGVLVGVLVRTGATVKIAETIVHSLGEKSILISLALSVFFLTGIGIFVNVAVLTIVPIALVVGKKINISKWALLIAMSGAGKAGNVMSPNPVVIVAAEGFKVPLTSIMGLNIIPGLVGLGASILIAQLFIKKGPMITTDLEYHDHDSLPSFLRCVSGPIFAIFLLMLNPLLGIEIDPLVALPAGGIFGLIMMQKMDRLGVCLHDGVQRMQGVVTLLIGTGALVGVIKASQLNELVVFLLEQMNINQDYLALVSGLIMTGGTASATAGATTTVAAFYDVIANSDIPLMWAAAMTVTGSSVLEHLPHGSYFHNTGLAMHMSIRERMGIIGQEALIGLVIMSVSIITWVLH